MGIYATSSGEFEKAPAGNHTARCYEMIEIGTVVEAFQGKPKLQKKVRISWELYNTQKTEDATKLITFSQEFTLSTSSKSNLGSFLSSWRGKEFTPDEAKKFDITKIVGAACFLNIIHKTSSSDATRSYAKLASVSPVPAGIQIPPAFYQPIILEYEKWNDAVFNQLPDFLKDKIMSSVEYKAMTSPKQQSAYGSHIPNASDITQPIDDLPF